MKRTFKLAAIVVARSVSGLFGLVGMVMGLALCLTIIGLLPGALMFLGGSFLFGLGIFGNPDTMKDRFPFNRFPVKAKA